MPVGPAQHGCPTACTELAVLPGEPGGPVSLQEQDLCKGSSLGSRGDLLYLTLFLKLPFVAEPFFPLSALATVLFHLFNTKLMYALY